MHGGGALVPSVAPRALPREARAGRGLRGGQVWGCGPHGAAAASVLGGAGEQAEPGVKSLAVTWGKLSKLASHTRNGKNSWFGCVDLKGQPCPTMPPASPAAAGLTCRSPLHRRSAVTAGWTPGRCGTCARCAAGTTAHAGHRTAPSRLEGPEVGPPRAQRVQLPPASKKTHQPRAWVPAAGMVGPRADSVLSAGLGLPRRLRPMVRWPITHLCSQHLWCRKSTNLRSLRWAVLSSPPGGI